MAVAVLALYVAAAAGATDGPRLLIIGIDGLRPDAIAPAHTPALDRLMREGAYSLSAQTTDIATSGPAWSSLLTGVWRAKHGVSDNEFIGARFDAYPSLFARLKSRRPDVFVASIVAWAPLNQYLPMRPDFARAGLSDEEVERTAGELLQTGNADAVFVHFNEVDLAGHRCCFEPDNLNYRAAIERSDQRLGHLLESLRERRHYLRENWLVVVATDHGGIRSGHGFLNTPQERTTFVILAGPQVCHGRIEPAPDIVDVAVTALAHMGVPAQAHWGLDGRVIGVDDCTQACDSGQPCNGGVK
ncbi:MAG: alkaline phosphatase family protein [Gammaproteobacteria bacterium]|nr:alkaline phosphatase family protein [Gammaproteobacteria bacterium]